MQSPSPNHKSTARVRSANVSRAGFTMVELMVAAGITLVLFIALLEAFKSIGDSVATARATMEMSGQLRSVTHRLREDLKGVTVPMRPWIRPGAGEGYFEYLEGTLVDTRNPANDDTAGGDYDDVLMFTARSDAEPFVGRYNGNIIESRVAEIIWWVRFTPLLDDENGNSTWDPGEQLTLHRRVLLVRPDLNVSLPADPGPHAGLDPNDRYALLSPLDRRLKRFYDNNDISVRVSGSNLEANSLGDLTKRENRFAHNRTTFPHPINTDLLHNFVQTFFETIGSNEISVPNGHDVIASNLLAFDIRVYDPLAPIYEDTSGAYALAPGDNEYNNRRSTSGATPIGRGAFVDLRYIAPNSTLSQFSGGPHAKSQLTTPTYCTWSFHYEHDGIAQDDGGSGPADEGTNGLDDDQQNGVDDIDERETMPPYPRPLRGLKVSIRMLEPDSEQVQQFSVVKDFTPE